MQGLGFKGLAEERSSTWQTAATVIKAALCTLQHWTLWIWIGPLDVQVATQLSIHCKGR